MEWRAHGYEISTDPARLDRAAVWGFLRTSYWSPGVERTVVERAIDNSLPFGLYAADGVYERFGFRMADPARIMERRAGASPESG
jgi:hypothetical protein